MMTWAAECDTEDVCRLLARGAGVEGEEEPLLPEGAVFTHDQLPHLVCQGGHVRLCRGEVSYCACNLPLLVASGHYPPRLLLVAAFPQWLNTSPTLTALAQPDVGALPTAQAAMEGAAGWCGSSGSRAGARGDGFRARRHDVQRRAEGLHHALRHRARAARDAGRGREHRALMEHVFEPDCALLGAWHHGFLWNHSFFIISGSLPGEDEYISPFPLAWKAARGSSERRRVICLTKRGTPGCSDMIGSLLTRLYIAEDRTRLRTQTG